MADLSQRELAARLDAAKSTVAAAETGTRDLPATLLARAAGVAGLRLALLDADGHEVRGMDPDAVRDRGGRCFPAHLDTILSEERGSRWEHRPNLPQPTYTFDRRLPYDDPAARTEGRPDDHLLPRPGDSPRERAAERRAERLRRWRQAHEEHARRRLAGELPRLAEPWVCTCPPACDELDDRSGRPVHADGCPCACDIG